MALTKVIHPMTDLGTAAPLDVGTSANEVVQLDANAKLPAVDGSQLTGIAIGNDLKSEEALNTESEAEWTSLDTDTTHLSLSVEGATVASGTPDILVQVGDSSAYLTTATDYRGQQLIGRSTGTHATNDMVAYAGIRVAQALSTSHIITGNLQLERVNESSFIWLARWTFTALDTGTSGNVYNGACSFTLTDDATRIKVRTDGGQLFSAGTATLYTNKT